ncbi:MAG TPA: ubiquinone biosynthesis regulatory protein kinase UbiB [Gammaproteobacteria bacterium]|nr:ubiquinone biosynthesis regulatory protein kinase UbiB [Gammaproteobacteria bacterium]
MISFSQLLRLLYIAWVLVRHGLDEVILATHLFRPIRFIGYLVPWHWYERKTPRAVRIRKALEDLGPIFVKFGQILSTRQDLLPDDVALELARLQDRVTPFDGERARQIVELAFQQPIADIYHRFDEQPLASASIAQVHAATLKSGEDVVVKVLRPGVEKDITRDVSLLHYIAGLAERYWRDGRRLRPCEVIDEFEKTLYDELDLLREAANASQLRRNFRDSGMLYVPEIYWNYCRRNVITMERIYGVAVNDLDALRRTGVDLKTLSEQGVEIFFTQVFKHNFFHADMHPGNIFVSPEGQYMAVDFGIMGTLSPEDQRYLAENFLAFFRRDYQRVAELHVESEWVPHGTRIDEFESAIRSVCEPIFERPLKEISFGQLLLRLFQTARRFDMEIQPQLVLLQKTLLNIEGLGRQLYPDLDLWQTAKPFLERWMSEQVGPRAFMNRMRRSLPEWSEHLPEIPELMHRTLQQAMDGKLRVQWESRELEKLRKQMHRSNQRSLSAILGGSLLISASLIYGLDGLSPAMFAGAPLLTWILGGLAVLFLVYAWTDD